MYSLKDIDHLSYCLKNNYMTVHLKHRVQHKGYSTNQIKYSITWAEFAKKCDIWIKSKNIT